MTIITLSLTFLSSLQPKHIPEFESAKGVEGGEGSGWEMLKGNTQVVNWWTGREFHPLWVVNDSEDLYGDGEPKNQKKLKFL